MKNLTFKAQIKDGKILFDRRDLFDLYIASLTGKVKVSVKRVRKVRSTGKDGGRNMNGYYWLYLTLLEKETGNEANDLHDFLKKTFLKPRIKTLFGKEVELAPTTTEITSGEMWNYMLKIEELSGVPIPPHPESEI